MLRWLHGLDLPLDPHATGVLPILSGALRVLPVLGIEFLPAGLPLPAQDIRSWETPSDTR